MSLRIRRLKLHVATMAGEFGSDHEFPNGLVLLRADNSSGKSTYLKALVYGLGLERMFGPANQPPLSPALLSVLEEGANEWNVVGSSVILEIENQAGEALTIERQIAGANARDWRLVTVWTGRVIDKFPNAGPGQNFYVRDPGAATREAGFHNHLAKFIGWKIPETIKYDGQTAPLYLECVLPLFYVEQRHGWSAIQATTPKYFQIRDVERKALEFLLQLDAAAQDLSRKIIDQRIADLRSNWAMLSAESDALAQLISGSVRHIPLEPLLNWPPEKTPAIEIYTGKGTQPLESAIAVDRENLHKLLTEVVPTVADTISETEAALRDATERLKAAESLAEELDSDIELETSELRSFETRLTSLEEDLKKNQDVERLRKYGATSLVSAISGNCPTCHQKVNDSLLPQPISESPMTVAENIEYIRSQVQTFEKMRGRLAESSVAKNRRRSALYNSINEIRENIRSLKRTLISDGRAPSIAAVRDRIILEERIARGQTLQEKFSSLLGRFAELSQQWAKAQADRKSLNNELLSQRDRQKLNFLEERFLELERKFGFKSFATDRISLSREHYKPTREGFDLVYDVSASDNIRTICAYVIALLEIARTLDTNHPGLVVLDEPRQQNMKWKDLTEVLRRCGDAGKYNQQVIVASSDTEDEVRAFANDVQCTVISIQSKFLKRLPERS